MRKKLLLWTFAGLVLVSSLPAAAAQRPRPRGFHLKTMTPAGMTARGGRDFEGVGERGHPNLPLRFNFSDLAGHCAYECDDGWSGSCDPPNGGICIDECFGNCDDHGGPALCDWTPALE